ncbi:MAG: Ig-like domain-containing protein, partial [Propionicimonas sp.]|nr:Ig-like domain-containing protein [Propionicimonas sp.]
ARATRSGTLTTTLSNGKEYAYDVTVPSASDITGWDVTVESWRPNATAGDLVRTETIDGLTTTNYKTSTVKTPINVKLDKLTTWDKIPEVGKAVSGTGHYEASFNWDTTAASGAYLDFGDTLEESMKVWINGKKVGGDVSTNPTKVKKDVGGVGKATIDDGTGKQVPLVGKNLYTGGINWLKPIVDVSPYLVNGSNDIVIEYTSSLSNVQLDRGVATVSVNKGGWWKYDIDYLSFGPSQAKLVPFVDVAYTASLDQLSDAVASAEELVANVNSGMYTEATATAFLAALDAAKAVLADNQAADAQRTSVRTALESAVKALTIHVEMVVDRVKLNQSQLRLVKGKTLKLEEGVYFTNGTTAYAGAATWKSSNTKVATVTKDGKVKAKKPGTATITVTSTKANAAGKKVTAKVKVTVVKKKPKAKVTKVSASVPKTMAVGKTAYITGKYSSAKATGIKVTYKSSKTKVATIDKVGRIQAKAKGTVKITVRAGSKSKTYTVKVK